MVRSALPALPLDDIDLLVIENVGNLVCPAEFRVGEDARRWSARSTEGEDKPLKYPLMFRPASSWSSTRSTCCRISDFDLEQLRTTSSGAIPAPR
jgi:hydrogenase nickel incorporation protein HypB